ncbi:hypothetical protein ABBQ38_007121 [Trebouxia sp. C0009 RCD-2024]
MSDLRLDRSHAEDCTTVRHGQAQQSDPTSVPASVTLLDLLHEVPTLPGLLNADAQKACQLPAEDSSVASVHLVGKAEDQQRYGAIRLLRPQHASASDLAWVNLAAQQLAHQMTAKWPHIHLFSLANVKDLLMVIQGDWPVLKHLDVSDNCLDAEGMALLGQGELAPFEDT